MRKILTLVVFLAACSDSVVPPGVPADAGVVDIHHPDAAPDASTGCGNLNESCCKVGPGCNGGAHADIYCSTDGVCLAPVPDCGGEGQACCNPLCEPSGVCFTWPCEGNQECQAGTCVVVTSPAGCGAEDEACCVHPGTTITFCDLGLDCDGQLPDGTRTCI